jgi:hypothetical protein
MLCLSCRGYGWIPACAGMTHRRRGRAGSCCPCSRFCNGHRGQALSAHGRVKLISTRSRLAASRITVRV